MYLLRVNTLMLNTLGSCNLRLRLCDYSINLKISAQINSRYINQPLVSSSTSSTVINTPIFKPQRFVLSWSWGRKISNTRHARFTHIDIRRYHIQKVKWPVTCSVLHPDRFMFLLIANEVNQTFTVTLASCLTATIWYKSNSTEDMITPLSGVWFSVVWWHYCS